MSNAAGTTDTYPIMTYRDLPDPDRCYTFDNGVDLFGEEDPEMNRIRKKYGEAYWGDRLLLYRQTKDSELMAKLWLSFTLETGENYAAWFANLIRCSIKADRKAYALGINTDSHLVDWARGEPTYEFSFEAIGPWERRMSMHKVTSAFLKEWKLP